MIICFEINRGVSFFFFDLLYICEVLQPEVVPFLQGIPEAIFQQDNACPYIAKTVWDFCLAQYMKLFPWPAYLPDMLPIEYGWDILVCCTARDPHLATTRDEISLCMQAVWNTIPQADIQNLFDSLPRRIAALIAALGGYTKYLFRAFFFFQNLVFYFFQNKSFVD